MSITFPDQISAEYVANLHKVIKRDGSAVFLPDVADCRSRVTKIYDKIISTKGVSHAAVMPAEEWLCDNFHIIAEQYENVISHLKKCGKSAFRGMPTVIGFEGETLRIYDIAKYMIEIYDSRIDEACLKEFLDKYQNVSALTSAEISNLGEMIRIALLVKISKICESVDAINLERQESEKLFERLNRYLDDGDALPSERKRAIDVWISSTEELTPVLAETVLRMAASENGNTDAYRAVFDLKLAGRKTSVDKMITTERNLRASLGITMGNAIRTLSMLSTFDWDTLNSELCTVERILERDPSGVFAQMDRDSRGYYIRCAENIARRADISAVSVALAAVEKSIEVYKKCSDDFKGHVGYYLCDNGVSELSGKFHKGFRIKMPKRPRGFVASATFMACTAISASVLTFMTAVIIARETVSLWESTLSHVIAVIATVIPAFIVYMNISVSVIQNVFAKFYKPVVLPAMNYDTGIPKESSVFFVMPVLMNNSERVKEIMNELEIIYLANRDENIYFAVIADAAESDTKNAEWDSDVYNTGLKEAERLNELYGSTNNRKFFFFYRPRVFHNCEGRWLGRERKRGALIDFNKIVAGDTDHNLLGMTENVPAAKFVLTVDADTRIPNNVIRKMAAICAHPLNRPQVEYSGGCAFVKRGYGILQPAVMTEPVRESRTLFAEIYTGDIGIDSYFARNSDFYFDVCSEGIYTGKGMYDPKVFNEISKDTFRDETVLSHDLLEGSYMRTAFTSNIMIFDGFPGNYSAYIKRQHRWIRGDWQLLPYKKESFINRIGRKVKNPLNFISLYKMTNNLQRSLGASCGVFLFAIGMIFMPSLAALWHFILLLHSYYQWLMYPSMKTFKRCSLSLCSLPHEAYMSLDAIIRTLWRINVSHRHLLSWVTAADAERGAVKTVTGYYKFMWPCVLVGLLTMSPVGILWLASPLIVFKTGEIPAKRKPKRMIYEDLEILSLCRRMWGFYEDFTPENSFLPPDNVQFKPELKVAERTSPTNIGFFILSTAQAAHLGFISLSHAVWLISRTLDTVEKMHKINGHLLNWYDTKTLEILNPPFISTVDSGNMAVCMITAAKILSDEYNRIYENPADVIKSRFFGIKALADIIRDDVKISSEDFFSFPTDFDGENLTEWRIFLENCINFCRNKPDGENSEKSYILKLRNTAECYLDELKNSIKVSSGKDSACGCINCDTKMLCDKLTDFAYGMDFKFLFDGKKGCFATGFSVKENRLSDSHYDIAVSEARLTVYFAIAKGDVSSDAFYRPARRFLDKGKGILRSWSGTAFEYLLPELFFRSYPGLLWDKTTNLMIKAQMDYGRLQGVPWGISESGYNMRDMNLNYQYKAFGVPKLAMNFDCCDGLVIAPYASIMAMEFAPERVKDNIKYLKEKGAFGKYGFCEAIDFSRGREGTVDSYMAHHIGMSFTGCVNYLDLDLTGKAFSSVPAFRACELLLAEKCDKSYGRQKVDFGDVSYFETRKENDAVGESDYFVPLVYDGISSKYPCAVNFFGKNTSLFMNELGDNTLMLGDISVTCDKGLRFFIKECNSGELWTAFVDSGIIGDKNSEKYRVLFYPERAIFCRNEDRFASELHVCVSGEDNCAVYRLDVANGSDKPALFEITVFTEIAVSRKSDFCSHRSFSDINTVTERDNTAKGIVLFADKICRSGSKEDISAFMSVWADKHYDGALQFDTDTVSFAGRGYLGGIPSAVSERRPLGAKQGAVINPCFASRVRLAAAPGETVNLYTTIGAALGFEDTVSCRDRVRLAAKKYCDGRAVARSFDLAYTNAVIERERLRLSREFLEDCTKILKQIYNPEINIFANSEMIDNTRNGILPGLWQFGISGKNPIMFAEVFHRENNVFIEKIIKVWQFLHGRGVRTDLVISVCEEEGYLSPLYSFVEYKASVGMCDARAVRNDVDCRIYVVKACQFGSGEIDSIKAASAVWLVPARRKRIGTVCEKAADEKITKYLSALTSDNKENKDSDHSLIDSLVNSTKSELCFDNGYGGFSPSGQNYVIYGKKSTPAPWINCISSFYGDLGFTVSESGEGFLWYFNSHEFRITPWSSSAAHTCIGDAVYVRNEKNGGVFPLITGIKSGKFSESRYITKHGFGFSEFETVCEGLKTKLTVFAHSELPLKISIAEIENIAHDSVEISLAYYLKPVMGELCEEENKYIGTAWDDRLNVLTCRNMTNKKNHDIFAQRIFVCSSLIPDSFTGDDSEFFGNEFQKRILSGVPVAMSQTKSYLSDKSGFGMNPCLATKNTITIKSGAVVSLVYILAAEPKLKKDLIEKAVEKMRNSFNAFAELDSVKNLWNSFLGTIQVKTPDKAFDFMVNGWLLYQVKSCRIDGRSAFYQSGGAYGFRDQLQDAVSLLHADCDTVKKLILLCASRQYEEGDVQHWWHPPENRGVRTNYSDDLLWLPYAVFKYVVFTDDTSILFEKVPFLRSEPLSPTEHDRYELAEVTEYSETLFVHCKRAIEHSLKFGTHGIPLMKGGDWNDGMNKVGENGGESVWLGWFLCKVLKCMQYLSDRISAGINYNDTIDQISSAIECSAWENDRYIRAFYGDGTMLGSSSCAECEIDSISQSWSVLSGAGNRERAEIAINTAYTNLVDTSSKTIRLLAPPFEGLSDKNPGYISDYPAGIRENGAQYTHAAIWLTKSFYEIGDISKGYELLSMLNPINHSRTEREADIYKTEPYVIAADVYYGGENTGRGGWTWYTGSAGWYYRLCVENLLGIVRTGNILNVCPKLPPEWHGKATVQYRFNGKLYNIDLSKGSQKIILE